MISVCMATYNGEKYLKEQLDSILKQIKSSDELIISDDGSTDSTCTIITEYQKEYKNIISHHYTLLYPTKQVFILKGQTDRIS